jgi:hypothetical protein
VFVGREPGLKAADRSAASLGPKQVAEKLVKLGEMP